MKNIKYTLSSALLSFLLFACNSKSSIYNLDTLEGAKEVKNLLITKFEPSKEITELSLTTEGNELFSLSIEYDKEGIPFYQNYYAKDDLLEDPTFDESGSKVDNILNKVKSIANTRTEVYFAPINNLNIELLTTKYQEGKKVIGDEFGTTYINNIVFTANKKGEFNIRFHIMAYEKGAKPVYEGNTEVWEYYDFIFEIDENGELSQIE